MEKPHSLVAMKQDNAAASDGRGAESGQVDEYDFANEVITITPEGEESQEAVSRMPRWKQQLVGVLGSIYGEQTEDRRHWASDLLREVVINHPVVREGIEAVQRAFTQDQET